MYLTDSTTNKVMCHVLPTVYSMGTPYHAEAIGERPGDTLPGFTTYPMHCTVDQRYPPFGYQTCYQMYSGNQYILVNMVNCAYGNITVRPVDSTSTFNQEYVTSGCT